MALVILSILMVLGVSGLSRVRERSQTVTCVSRLKQLGVAIFAYANDYNGTILPRHYGLYRTAPETPPEKHLRTWPARLANLGYVTNLDIFFCPSFFPRNESESKRDVKVGATDTYGLRMWVAPGSPWGKEREEPKRLSSISEPGDFFLVADSVWTAEGWKSQGYGLVPASTEQLVHLRHQHKANALFADGHVEAKPGEYFEALGKPERQMLYHGGDKERKFYTTSKMNF